MNETKTQSKASENPLGKHTRIDNKGAGNCAFYAYAQMLADNIYTDEIKEPTDFETLKTAWNTIHPQNTIQNWAEFTGKIKAAYKNDIFNNNSKLPNIQGLLGHVLRKLATTLNYKEEKQILENKQALFQAWKTLNPESEKYKQWTQLCGALYTMRTGNYQQQIKYNELVNKLITQMEQDKTDEAKVFSHYDAPHGLHALQGQNGKHPLHELTDNELPGKLPDFLAAFGNRADRYFDMPRRKSVPTDMTDGLSFLSNAYSTQIKRMDDYITKNAWKKLNFFQKFLWYVIPGYKGYRKRKLIYTKTSNAQKGTRYKETTLYALLTRNAKQRLTDWWQQTGSNTYWNHMAANARWGGGAELGQLASYFGTNLQIYPYMPTAKTDTDIDARFEHNGRHWMYYRPNTTRESIDTAKNERYEQLKTQHDKIKAKIETQEREHKTLEQQLKQNKQEQLKAKATQKELVAGMRKLGLFKTAKTSFSSPHQSNPHHRSNTSTV